MDEIEFYQVTNNAQREKAGVLIREYLDSLNKRIKYDYNIEFDVKAMVQSDLSDEIKFHPPDGRFYLVKFNGQPAGVGCLKKLQEGIGEIQRMYVSPDFRGKGIGRAIAIRLVDDARSIGYRKLKLESLEFLDAAHSLYRSLGFKEIEPYDENSMESFQPEEQLDKYYTITVFMEKDLY